MKLKMALFRPYLIFFFLSFNTSAYGQTVGPNPIEKGFKDFIFLLGQGLGIYPSLTEEEFDAIKNMAGKIQAEFPPENWVVIGPGRSPAPITTYLKLDKKNIDYAWNLPLSNFRYGGRGDGELDPSLKGKLWAHFDRFLPSQKELKGRNILLLDFTLTGGSLMATRDHLNEYYREKAKEGTNDSIPAIKAGAMVKKDQLFLKLDGDYLILTLNGALEKKLSGQGYDDFAEFGRFDVKRDLSDDNLMNPRHQDFKAAMMAKMEADIEACKSGPSPLEDLIGALMFIGNFTQNR